MGQQCQPHLGNPPRAQRPLPPRLTWEISRQGSLPTWAPVKPYTELALTLSASCRPSSTCRLKGSVSRCSSALALCPGRGQCHQHGGAPSRVPAKPVPPTQPPSSPHPTRPPSQHLLPLAAARGAQTPTPLRAPPYLLRAASRFSRISGSSPLRTEALTKRSPVGVRMNSSGDSLRGEIAGPGGDQGHPWRLPPSHPFPPTEGLHLTQAQTVPGG